MLRQNIIVMIGNFNGLKTANIQDIHTYHIEVQGQLDKNSLNESGPVHIIITRADQSATILKFHSDQSGLIGLLRYLHQQGYVIRSMCQESDTVN